MLPALWTVPETAEFLAISIPHFYVLQRRGLIGPMPIQLGNKSVRFDPDELGRWITAGAPPRDQWQAAKNHPLATEGQR
jgi:predicted DNA-binding transcriptional regulator AlpA